MKRLILLLVLLCAACQTDEPARTASPLAEPAAAATREPLKTPKRRTTASPTRTRLPPSMTPSPTHTPAPPTLTFTPFPTPSDYEPYTIDFLRSRTYGDGNIEIMEVMEETDALTRYLIRYPSDGLTIYGFANVPKGEGPFPVIIAIHGYVDPAIYETLDYTASALDVITQAGYIVIHPDLRGYPPSDNGDNLFRVGMAVDVLNLIALIKSESGPVELFTTAAPESIGLWGHSLGGNIALRVLTVSPDVKAAALFASMSGDERKNAELLLNISADPMLQTELNTAPVFFERISPRYYYSSITAPIQLHHGEVDQTVPVAWAEETCKALTTAGIQIECIYYPTEDHTFRSRVADQLYSSLFSFYEMYLSP